MTTTIDCGNCAVRASAACDDCVVTFLCDRDPQGTVVFDAGEARTLRLLAAAGLAPGLRHRRG